MRLIQTTRFARRNLPHWEVENGRYFVTVRCADSLPHDAIMRLRELEAEARRRQDSGENIATQRIVFRALESYLDRGLGKCLLRQPGAAKAVVDELESLTALNVSVPHFTVMPNHVHVLIEPQPNCAVTLSAIMKRFKGRSATGVRRVAGGSGPFWQREWFDHWVRDDAEKQKAVTYIRNNPVKAGLVQEWNEHPWTR